MVPGQHMVTDPVVRIGDRCMIGRGSHIVGHFDLEIGDDVHTGPYVYITDQNHGYENPDEVVHVQWPSDVPVHIGAGSWLGTGVVILPGTELGRNVVVGAGAVVRGRLPRPLRHRRRAGPGRPPLRARIGMGDRGPGTAAGAAADGAAPVANPSDAVAGAPASSWAVRSPGRPSRRRHPAHPVWP